MSWTVLMIIFSVLFTALTVLGILAIIKKPASVFANRPEQQNQMEGKRVAFVENNIDIQNADGVKGHLEPIGDTEKRKGIYVNCTKRILDLLLSFGGLLILSPLYLALTVAIYIDDPGPIYFKQKRVGKNKQYFVLHKYRSMKMNTPARCIIGTTAKAA